MKNIGKAVVLSMGLLLASAWGSMIPWSVNTVEAASTVINKITYQTTNNVYMRSGAGTNYKVIIMIPKGKVVTATEKKGNWYKVSYQYVLKGKSYTKTGWVSGSYLKEYDQYIQTSGTYYFTKKTVNLYSAPNTKKKAVTSLAGGNGLYSTRKVVNSVGQTWYEVSFNGKKLYVISSDVVKVSSKSFAATKYIANKDTFLYSSFGSAYAKLEKTAKGTIVSSSFSVGDWYKVSYKNKTGYVYIKDFARYTGNNAGQKPSSPVPQQPAQDQQTTEQPKQPDNSPNAPVTEQAISGKTFAVRADLNVRKEPNTTSDSLKVIPKGTIIVPTHKTSNNWYKITYNNTIGYVSGDYVTEVKTGAPLNGKRDGYQFIDLRTTASVTAQQINRYIENYVHSTNKPSVLLGKGQVFIDAGKKYGVNALYLAAHAIHESGFGTSRLALTKYNLFGYGAYDASPFVSAYRFSSVEESIDYIARKVKATYLNPAYSYFKGAYLGFRTNTLAGTRVNESSEGMNFYYASDPYWGQSIARHMANILAYDSNYYKSAKPNETVPASPGIPQGSDVFPENIVAVANQDLALYDQKGANKSITVLKKGSTFILLEKTNDYWVRLKYNNQEYWTNSIKFYEYKKYITVKNLGSVNVITLNVRPTPSTTKDPIARLKMGEYVQLSLTDDGKLEIQNSWYKIILKDGRAGWVSSQYIVRELN
ncbi:SH3 domain-containing protein [Parageobacillus toebii]|uniref:SH3 domain-containing protein n=1 Tax=Parageobacillus toebii TaxID=153151 RepID=UPI0019673556|nr:SH3 domain-containing protein [Parageobacillus toebii]QSB49442.1 SH3 domain-containing protein [Parageobacillus toebii]